MQTKIREIIFLGPFSFICWLLYSKSAIVKQNADNTPGSYSLHNVYPTPTRDSALLNACHMQISEPILIPLTVLVLFAGCFPYSSDRQTERKSKQLITP